MVYNGIIFYLLHQLSIDYKANKISQYLSMDYTLPNSSNTRSVYMLPESIRIYADESGAYFAFIIHQNLQDGSQFRRRVCVRYNFINSFVSLVEARII